MSKIKRSSGDKYAPWEEVKITRQAYANAEVNRFRGAFVPDVDFATLLAAFRQAGLDYDRWMRARG